MPCRVFLCGALAALLAPSVHAQITFSIIVEDPAHQLDPYAGALRSHLLAAGAAWSDRLEGTAALTIRVRPVSDIPYSSGYSFTSAYVGTVGGIDVFEQGAANHIRTGVNPSPGDPDIEFVINPAYLGGELWLDSDPVARTAPVPTDRTDAMSVCLHELGHALAYNGWMNGFDGSLPGNYMSTFDRWVVLTGGNFFFTGSAARGIYGGAVPVTYGNPCHLGNNPPRPGSDLLPQLMNGVVFYRGHRYAISELDWGVLTDAGLPVLGPPCRPDVNGDGRVNVADFLAFLSLYAAGDPRADFNASGGIDVSDFLAFLAAYSAGC
jgi:hypothetical protein